MIGLVHDQKQDVDNGLVRLYIVSGSASGTRQEGIEKNYWTRWPTLLISSNEDTEDNSTSYMFVNDDLHLKVMCDFVQIKHITGSTADTFLEYIQRNLPEGMAMKVTRVNHCICCHIVSGESVLELAIAQLCFCLWSYLSTRCCHHHHHHHHHPRISSRHKS